MLNQAIAYVYFDSNDVCVVTNCEMLYRFCTKFMSTTNN